MDREELLSHVRFAKNIKYQMSNLLYERASYDRPVIRLPNVPINYRWMAVFAIAIIVALTEFFGSILIFLLIFLPLYYPWLVKKINQYLIKRRKAADQDRIREINEKLEELDVHLIQNTIIPRSYLFVGFLERCENYLLNLRANTLQECINLYEEEQRFERAELNKDRRHRESIDQFERHHKENVNLQRENQEIAQKAPHIVGSYIMDARKKK